jgi:membrane protein YqaA with SNARE-associated domain
MDTWIPTLLNLFSLPEVGLSTVFVVALLSATLLPMGSEPAVFALVKLNPELFWPAVLVATVGNTVGGAISWWMGLAVHRAVHKVKPALERSATELKALQWLERFGPKACLLAWLPARLAAVSYALAGSFEDAIGNWRIAVDRASRALLDRTEDLLARVGKGSLQPSLAGVRPEALDAATARGAWRIVARSAWIWLAVIALLVLAGEAA